MRLIGGSETQRFVLVDGNNILHKAHYVYETLVSRSGGVLTTSKDGFNTGTIYGFVKMLNSYLKKIKHYSKVYVFFDGVSGVRRSLDPEYKSNRNIDDKSVSSINTSGLDALKEVLRLLGVNICYDPWFESDDLIYSFCVEHPQSIRMIISDDKDFFQLLTDPRIVVYRPCDHEFSPIDAEKSESVWGKINQGKHPPISPGAVRLFKSICGDPSDNIKGIKGFRKSIGADLAKSMDIDGLKVRLANYPDVKVRDQVLSHMDVVSRNFSLAGFYRHDNVQGVTLTAKRSLSEARNYLQEYLSIYDLSFDGFNSNVNIPAVPVMEV